MRQANIMNVHPDMHRHQLNQNVPVSLASLIPETALDVLSPAFREVRKPKDEDEKMASAALEVLETGSLTPLLKEELRYTIQARRLAEGKQELQVEFEDPDSKRVELTPEEEERVQKRREQNRSAAQRFRQKQKDTIRSLQKKTQQLQSENTALRAQLKQVQTQNGLLCDKLQQHVQICPLSLEENGGYVSAS